jgi:hypothetical protein
MLKIVRFSCLVLSVAVLCMATGCSKSANMLGANVRMAASCLTPVAVLTPTSHDPLNNQGNPDGYGSHNGELNDLKIELVYLDPKGYNQTGHSVYYIGQEMDYEIRLTNLGNRTFNCLDVSSQQQYYDNGTCQCWWWGPNQAPVSYTKGEPMPGDSTNNWNGVQLPPHSMVVLKGGYLSPNQTASGLDQTAVLIKHCNTPGQNSEHDALMYYNPEQGVFDPPGTASQQIH